MASAQFKHFTIIDSLRGIAACMVCLFHFVCTTTDYVSSGFVLQIFSFGKYGVHLFFVISGIVIPLSMLKNEYTFSKCLRYLAKRFTRIEPPYLASIIVYVIYVIVRQFIYSQDHAIQVPTTKEILIHLGYLVPFIENGKWFINTYWSLAVEFQYYIALCILFPFMIHRIIYVRILFSSLFLFSGFLFANSAFLPHWSPIFMLGIAYVSYIYKKQSLIEFVIWQLLATAMVLYAFDFTILCFCISTLLMIHFLPTFKTKLTLFFGNISYSLYLLHGLTGGFVINYLSHTFRSPLQQFFVILLGFFVATFASYLFYRLIEKPSQRWSKSITL